MNKKFILCFIASLSLIVCACTKSKSHHSSNQNSAACEELGIKKYNVKIINGTTCDKSKSAIAKLSIIEANGEEGLCTGTVISSNAVLTASHCLTGNIVSIEVEVGGKKYDAVQAFMHPQYNQDYSDYIEHGRNDVAIIKIADTFQIAPLPIITSRTPQAGETLIVAGYGKDENGNTDTLKAAYMNVNKTYKSGFVLAYDDTHTNVCFGDSGGPAFGYVDGVLGVFGVTSSGTTDDCLSGDKTSFPGVYFGENLNFILTYATPKQL